MNSQEDTINASNKPVNKDKGDKKNMDTSNKQKLKKYYGLVISVIFKFYLFLKLTMIGTVPWMTMEDALVQVSIFYLFICMILVIIAEACTWFLLAIPFYLITVIGLIVSTYLIMTGHKRWFIVPMIVYCIDIVCRIYFLVTERTDFAGDTAGLVFAVFGVLISILYWRSGYEPAVSETELPEQKVDIKQ